MSIEDYEAEIEQLDAELADIANAIALGLGDDVQAEFQKARDRLLKARRETLEHIDRIRASTRH